MYENVQILREGVEYVFERLHRTVDGLTEKELDWKPLNESNNIRWILNHISRLSNISTMIYIKGDPSYLPEDWPEDYREKQHTLEKLLGDISKGKAAVRAGLEDMKSADLLWLEWADGESLEILKRSWLEIGFENTKIILRLQDYMYFQILHISTLCSLVEYMGWIL